ncbi:hypothetical protein PoB_005426000 [Plakobranchus ocellatus]|uniref:Uncharacterized protein n=1 Tax=Plakobranchus ocellatus TaxID=259542 RepID=A0AAV4C7U0_9GAST|nr:hypothetical protein PoB_005426000 [Plakobranchus ocellatus]
MLLLPLEILTGTCLSAPHSLKGDDDYYDHKRSDGDKIDRADQANDNDNENNNDEDGDGDDDDKIVMTMIMIMTQQQQ